MGKGSGGDLGSMKLDGFATLYQDKLLALEKHSGGPEDDKMVGYLPHCTFKRLACQITVREELYGLVVNARTAVLNGREIGRS